VETVTVRAAICYATWRAGTFLTNAVIVMAIAILFFGLGPRVEPELFPVLTNMHAHDVHRAGKSVSFYIDAYKARACSISRVGWYAFAAGHVLPIAVTYPRGNEVTVTYPAGPINTGPYFATLPDISDQTFDEGPLTIWASIHYDCHPGWRVHQLFGPVDVPAESGK